MHQQLKKSHVAKSRPHSARARSAGITRRVHPPSAEENIPKLGRPGSIKKSRPAYAELIAAIDAAAAQQLR